MTQCGDINFTDFLDGRNVTREMKAHLLACRSCREELEATRKLIKLLVEARKDEEPEIDLPEKPLPDHIKELIRKRKKKWLEEKASRTAKGLGYESGEKEDVIRLITRRETDTYQNAAFSDDLLEGKRKKDKEDDDGDA